MYGVLKLNRNKLKSLPTNFENLKNVFILNNNKKNFKINIKFGDKLILSIK